ncbi:glycoside-pentoside-hexuronide (GPH):cation symporter [Treponema sp. C6A8]|uniref:glycoside-pentoside-hexuronide (GPH):cation symporter n=1 Tax=Treponema sp. C6A8 TaxID=1410609 RepID=UPI0004826134|nr:glycoside-pentoside-hexuronide (GPH):cation symporter [Treponema sp. C6A8]
MENKRKLGFVEKLSYGLGAVGKDMVYMLSASYILYYYQDIMGVSAIAMGIILLAARVFDAFNDPIMGIVVSKTKTKWGKFRPWLLIGTVTNAVILYLMFACPPAMNGRGLVAYAAVTYILWGVTYTMMDIPYWSMIPAFTEGGKEREGLSALARSCAGVGSAIVSILAVPCVAFLGSKFGGNLTAQYEQAVADFGNTSAQAVQIKGSLDAIGFKMVALAIAVLFVLFTVICCINIKEKSTVDVKTSSVGDMFKALFRNDQAVTMVIAIVMINTALYITSNLVIYFFKYDFSPAQWETNYTLFNTFGGGFQILAMMILFPIFRAFINTVKIFYCCFFMAFIGYIILLFIAFSGTSNFWVLVPSAFLIMSAIGMLNVVVTVFLANTVDYGELKNGHREEAVIFSMQTFVVKLSSGLSALIASIILAVFHISKDSFSGTILSQSSRMGLRMCMTLIPMAVLIIGLIVFKRHYILTDEKVSEISNQLKAKAE